MAEQTTKSILSMLCTTSSRIKDLSIKDGQLIFVQDSKKIALDFKGKRTFYNQITELENESERLSLSSPVNGQYYFVIGTAVLWTYQNGWIQITGQPSDIVFIETEMPTLGVDNKIYINPKTKEISVWDDNTQTYTVVANKIDVEAILESDIDSLFI